MAGRAVLTGPMKSDTARRMRRTAQVLADSHPEMVTAGHVRDAARVLEHGSLEGAKRHLDAAMETLTPRNLYRHGVTDDGGHAHAKTLMHQIHRHRLAVMDIEDAHGRNRQVMANRAAQRAGQKTNQMPDQGPQDAGLFSNLDLSARTAMLERTPAPYGKPGGPGLYGVAGNKHSDYFEQVVQALMRKRGMDRAQASRIAWGALRKWRSGGGGVHPEVSAAAGRALGQEAAAGARAHGHAGAYTSWQAIDLAVQLAATAGGAGGSGGRGGQKQGQGKGGGGSRPQSSNWQNESRVPAGQFGGGRFGSGGGGQAQGGNKGKHPHNAAARKARKAQLEKKAASLRSQIHALVLAYRAATAHHKASSKTAAKAGKAQTPQQAAKAAKAATAAKSAGSTPRKKTAARATPAQLHGKIIALRAVLASVLAQIHSLANDMPAIELAAWQHEIRGPDGRFRSGGASRTGVTSRPVISQSSPAATAWQNRVSSATAVQQARTARSIVSDTETQLKATEDRKHRVKLAVHAGLVVAGALLALVLHQTGSPEALSAFGASAPLLVQELIDWAKKL
jgi:hypothetical protein